MDVRTIASVAPKKPSKRWLYITEWREFRGLSGEELADILDVNRATVHKWEKEQWRVTPDKQERLAMALKIQPEELWRRPDDPSIDALLKDQTPELKRMAADIVARMTKREQ